MKKFILFAIIKNVHLGNVSSSNSKSALLSYLQDAKLADVDVEFMKKYKVLKAIKNVHYLNLELDKVNIETA